MTKPLVFSLSMLPVPESFLTEAVILLKTSKYDQIIEPVYKILCLCVKSIPEFLPHRSFGHFLISRKLKQYHNSQLRAREHTLINTLNDFGKEKH